MAPSLQSVDSSQSYRLKGGSLEHTGEVSASSSSALLFKVPTKRPRHYPVGPNFGKDRLKPDNSPMKGLCTQLCVEFMFAVTVCVILMLVVFFFNFHLVIIFAIIIIGQFEIIFWK